MRFSKTSLIVGVTFALCGVVLGARLQSGPVQCMEVADAHVHHQGNVRMVLSAEPGDEVTLDASLAFTEDVIDPERGILVRPVSLHIHFVHRGVVQMAELSSLLLRPVDSTEAWTTLVGGLSRDLLEERDPPLPPLYYTLTVVPKHGFTWGTVRGTGDLDITAVEKEL